ncbi:MAG: HAD-IC family P-type ATPase [Myxococcota bacterium]
MSNLPATDDALAIVEDHAALAAVAGAIPIPVADFAAVSGITLKMLRRLADHYGVEFRTESARATISSLVSGSTSTLLTFGLLNAIPLLGRAVKLLVGPVVAGALTYGVGRVYLLHFSLGGSFLDFDPERFRDHFTKYVDSFKRRARRDRHASVSVSTEPKPEPKPEPAPAPEPEPEPEPEPITPQPEAELQPSTRNSDEIDTELRSLGRWTAISATGTGLAALGGLVSAPALSILSVPLTTSTLVPMVRHAWREYIEDDKLGFSALVTPTMGVVLLSGHVFAAGVAATMFFSGQYLLLKTLRRGQQTLASAFGQWSKTVWVSRDGVEVEIPLEHAREGEMVVVRPGSTVPVDGVLVDGELTLDARMFTGESRLAEKIAGDEVMAETLVVRGRGLVQTTRTGTSTKAARLERLIDQTASYEQELELRSRVMLDRTVGPTMGMAAVGFAVGGPVGAVNGIFSNCTDILWLSSPASMLRTLQIAANSGVLIKDGRSLDLLPEIDTVVFDKTGTLTLDRFALGQLYVTPGLAEQDLLKFAAAAEFGHEHPIARVLIDAAIVRGIDPSTMEIRDPSFDSGLGLRVEVQGRSVLLGSRRLFDNEGVPLPEPARTFTVLGEARGHTVVHLALDGRYAGAIELVPQIRPEAPQVLAGLAARGMEIMLLTGDEEEPTRQLAQSLGIQTWFSRTLPEQKQQRINALREQGRKVCFVGDGVNDALAMRRAHVSLSMTGASAIAVDSAQIILRDGSLTRLNDVFNLGQQHHKVQGRLAMSALVPTAVSFTGVVFAGLPIIAVVGIYGLGMAASMGLLAQQELRAARSRR